MLRFLGLWGLVLATACSHTPMLASDKKNQPVFSFGAIADCQYADREAGGTRLYRKSPSKLREAVKNLNTHNLEFVVHLGDFIDRDWKSFDVLTPITDELHHPIRHVVGNHDYSVKDRYKPDVHKRLGMPARYYHFQIDDWVFVAIDGNDLSYYGWPKRSPEYLASKKRHEKDFPNLPKWNGGVGPRQLQWLEEILTKADQNQKKVVLFSHFPVFPKDKHNLWNAPDLLALLEKYNSPVAWINGHNHIGAYGEWNGIHFITLEAMLDTEQSAYSIIHLYDQRIEIRGFGKQDHYALEIPER